MAFEVIRHQLPLFDEEGQLIRGRLGLTITLRLLAQALLERMTKLIPRRDR